MEPRSNLPNSTQYCVGLHMWSIAHTWCFQRGNNCQGTHFCFFCLVSCFWDPMTLGLPDLPLPTSHLHLYLLLLTVCMKMKLSGAFRDIPAKPALYWCTFLWVMMVTSSLSSESRRSKFQVLAFLSPLTLPGCSYFSAAHKPKWEFVNLSSKPLSPKGATWH